MLIVAFSELSINKFIYNIIWVSNCNDRRACSAASTICTIFRGSGLGAGFLAFSWIFDNYSSDGRKVSALFLG